MQRPRRSLWCLAAWSTWCFNFRAPSTHDRSTQDPTQHCARCSAPACHAGRVRCFWSVGVGAFWLWFSVATTRKLAVQNGLLDHATSIRFGDRLQTHIEVSDTAAQVLQRLAAADSFFDALERPHLFHQRCRCPTSQQQRCSGDGGSCSGASERPRCQSEVCSSLMAPRPSPRTIAAQIVAFMLVNRCDSELVHDGRMQKSGTPGIAGGGMHQNHPDGSPMAAMSPGSHRVAA